MKFEKDMSKITVKEWYDKKRSQYLLYFNKEWEYLHWDNSLVYETMMRMAIEKRYFGLTTFDEDVMIANTIVIRDLVKPRLTLA